MVPLRGFRSAAVPLRRLCRRADSTTAYFFLLFFPREAGLWLNCAVVPLLRIISTFVTLGGTYRCADCATVYFQNVPALGSGPLVERRCGFSPDSTSIFTPPRSSLPLSILYFFFRWEVGLWPVRAVVSLRMPPAHSFLFGGLYGRAICLTFFFYFFFLTFIVS